MQHIHRTPHHQYLTMNRKWRTNPGALHSVLDYPVFRQAIPPRDADYALADPTDLYAVYTVLHIENKQSELRWSSHGRFYYFLAQWEQSVAQKRVAAAPEGDEDPPPQIIPEGSEAALQLEAAQAAQQQQQQQSKKQKRQAQQQQGAGAPPAGGAEQQQQQQQAQPQQEEQAQQDAQPAGQQGSEAQPAAADPAAQPPAQPPAAAGSGAAQPAATSDAAAAPAEPPQRRTRTQIVVPVSSSFQGLTPELLQRLFSVRGVQAQQLLLALVDSNGVVTRSCLYNYIQAPLEGPGTANLELLDD